MDDLGRCRRNADPKKGVEKKVDEVSMLGSAYRKYEASALSNIEEKKLHSEPSQKTVHGSISSGTVTLADGRTILMLTMMYLDPHLQFHAPWHRNLIARCIFL